MEDFPPILQLVLLALLGTYVLVSVAARLSPALRGLWRDAEDVDGFEHVVGYTVVPALMLVAGVVTVVLGWDRNAPLDGGWTLAELTVGPISALLGVTLVVLAQLRGQRESSGTTGARAFLPLLLVLGGIGLIAFGAWTLGQTGKRHARERRTGGQPTSASPL
jgi:hypothetical protein